MERKRKYSHFLRSASAGLLVFFGACDSDTETIAVSSLVEVNGYFTPQGLAEESYQINVIDTAGVRQKLEDARVDETRGGFTFPIADTSLHQGIGASLPEQWTAMGHPPPDTAAIEGQFGAASAGYARVELMPARIPEGQATFTYKQLIFPISRSLALRGDKRLYINEPNEQSRFKLKTVGRTRVRIVDDKGAPIAGAKVSIIPFKADAAATTWAAPDIAPAFTLTSEDGAADAYPISTEGVEPKYQIAVLTPTQCIAVTPLRIFKASQLAEETIPVQNCVGDKFDEPKPAIEVSFPATVTTRQETIDKRDMTVAYINDPKIGLDIKTTNKNLRGLKVVIFEGVKPEGKVEKQYEFGTFANFIRFDVLQAFQGGLKQNGTMTIGIGPIYTDADNAQFGEPAFTYLVVRKSVVNQKIVAQYVKIESKVGSPSIIAGNPGVSFKITEAPCSADQEIGILVGRFAENLDDISFFPCAVKPILIDTDSLSFNPKRRGGFDTIKFFVRDIFGNVSADDINAINHLDNIYIDYGVADLKTNPINLGPKYGIVLASDLSNGTDDNPYLFPKVVLSEATLDTFALRFASPSECSLLVKTPEDGTATDAKGHLIHSFLIAATEQAALKSNKWVTCPKGLTLSPSLVQLPAGASDGLRFWLRTRDLAGNESNAIEQVVPNCSVDDTRTCIQ